MTTSSNNNFSLPPLYLEQLGGASLSVAAAASNDEVLVQLPSELVQHCLSSYASLGDLAKLAHVQAAWKNMLYDAAASDAASQWALSQALLQGTDGLVTNKLQAKNVLEQLATLTNKEGTDSDVEDDDSQPNKKNAKWYASQARKQLAYLYLDGSLADDSSQQQTGLQYLQSAHELDETGEAAYELAYLYEHGKYNVAVDVVQAAEWFTQSAERGHVEAMAELGFCYELGCGVEVDEEVALDWFLKAANLGHITSKFAVGEAFEEAKGVPQSDTEACLWYSKAALAGDEDSKRALHRLRDIARLVLPRHARTQLLLNE